VTGPKDVVANHPIGALDTDLRAACLKALSVSRQACRIFALSHSWENSARQFISHVTRAALGRRSEPSLSARATAVAEA